MSRDQKKKAASAAFRRQFSNLSKVFSSYGPLELAICLFSENVITQGTCNRIRTAASDLDIEKAYDLLTAVKKEIERNPNVLEAFCRALENESAISGSIKNIVGSIREEYEKQLHELKHIGDKVRKSNSKEGAPSVLRVESTNNYESMPAESESMLNPDLRRPPDWIRQTKPLLSPYLPQVGDIVVYFWQGHENYMDTVKKEKQFAKSCYILPDKMSPQECCMVMNTQYIVYVGTPTLCSVTLTSSREFTVKYHDMDGVPDFLVLKTVYDAALSTSWSPGDSFKSRINDGYHYGTVIAEKPFDDRVPDSNWQCYCIKWDDDQSTGFLSSWEMEPCGTKHAVSKLQEALTSSFIVEMERDRILKGLQKIETLLAIECTPFKKPVKVEDVPNYYKVVAFPTDLSTITRRLNDNFYRCKEALLWEVLLIQKNAIKFNEDDSLIVKHAKIVVQTLWNFFTDTTVTNPSICYKTTTSKELEKDLDGRLIELHIQAAGLHYPSIEKDTAIATEPMALQFENRVVPLHQSRPNISRRNSHEYRKAFEQAQQKIFDDLETEDNDLDSGYKADTEGSDNESMETLDNNSNDGVLSKDRTTALESDGKLFEPQSVDGGRNFPTDLSHTRERAERSDEDKLGKRSHSHLDGEVDHDNSSLLVLRKSQRISQQYPPQVYVICLDSSDEEN